MVRLEVDEESKLGDLVELIKEKTGVKDCSLKYGWPLKALELSPASLQTTVRDLNLRGETIVVVPLEAEPSQGAAAEPVKQKKQAPVQAKPMEPDETVVEWPERGGFVGMHDSPLTTKVEIC
jgi:ubiquitin thioesterase OTU1